MANKALATRQRMQFRVEPSQVPARARMAQQRPSGNSRPAVPGKVQSGGVISAKTKKQDKDV